MRGTGPRMTVQQCMTSVFWIFPMPLSDHIKPDAHRPRTREEIERGRTMYAEGFTVSRILAATNMSLGTLYYWLDGEPAVAHRRTPGARHSGAPRARRRAHRRARARGPHAGVAGEDVARAVHF